MTCAACGWATDRVYRTRRGQVILCSDCSLDVNCEYERLEPVNAVEFLRLKDQVHDLKRELDDAKYELRRAERKLSEGKERAG